MASGVLAALRSLLFTLWMATTVVPWAIAVLVYSIFVRGTPIYWLCAGWLLVEENQGKRWLTQVLTDVYHSDRLYLVTAAARDRPAPPRPAPPRSAHLVVTTLGHAVEGDQRSILLDGQTGLAGGKSRD